MRRTFLRLRRYWLSPFRNDFDVSGVGEYEQPRCPKCRSLDINFQELDPACLPERSSAYRFRSIAEHGAAGRATRSGKTMGVWSAPSHRPSFSKPLRITSCVSSARLSARQFFSREPADFGGVAGGCEFSSNPAAEKINQHVVILHALFGIAQDAVVDAEQVCRARR